MTVQVLARQQTGNTAGVCVELMVLHVGGGGTAPTQPGKMVLWVRSRWRIACSIRKVAGVAPIIVCADSACREMNKKTTRCVVDLTTPTPR